MKKIHIYSIVLSLVGVMCFGQQAFADTKNEGSKYLTEIGINHLEKGEYEAAAHEFSKALMLDPGNVQAKMKLNEMGISHGLYAGAQTRSSQMVDLSQHVIQYKQQVARLMLEKREMMAKFQELLLERDTVIVKSRAEKLEKEILTQELEKMAQKNQEQHDAHVRQIEDIEGMYVNKVNNMRNDIDYHTTMARRVRLDQKARVLEDKEEYYRDIVTQFSRAVDQLAQYEDKLNKMDDQYVDLKHKVSKVRAMDTDMLAFFEKNIDEQQSAIEDLKDKMVIDAVELGRTK